MGGRTDRLIRYSTAAVVVAVATIAAYVSYMHAYEVVRAHGEGPGTARLVPLTVDGLVYASSMVLLHCARHGRPVPMLARFLLGLGIAATLAANVAHGISAGVVGAAVAAWPAVALVGAYELLMWLVRSGADEPEPAREPAVQPAELVETGAPLGETTPEPAALVDDEQDTDQDAAARAAYTASVQAGEPLSERGLASRFGRSRSWARSRIAETSVEHRPLQLVEEGALS